MSQLTAFSGLTCLTTSSMECLLHTCSPIFFSDSQSLRKADISILANATYHQLLVFFQIHLRHLNHIYLVMFCTPSGYAKQDSLCTICLRGGKTAARKQHNNRIPNHQPRKYIYICVPKHPKGSKPP